MLKIAFFNHNSNPEIEKAADLIKKCVGADRFLKLDKAGGFQTVVNDQEVQICFFHQTPDNWRWDALKASGQLDRGHTLLFCSVSSSPLKPEVIATQGASATHYRFTVPSLAAAGLLNRGDQELKDAWAKFLDALCNSPFSAQDDGSITVSDKLSWFLNPDQSALLAFRLLCAAKKECGGGILKKGAFGTDLTIHAPEKLGDWLRPFGESDIGKAAKLIGVGRYTGQVEAVLQAAEKEWSELSNAISKFESAYEKQQASAS